MFPFRSSSLRRVYDDYYYTGLWLRQNMTREAYLVECEAEFVESLEQLFSEELVRKCVELAQKLEAELCTSLEMSFPEGTIMLELILANLLTTLCLQS